MKKWGALMLALCALCAAGRAETTIGELAAANALDALLARHAAYSINTIYYDEAGKETFVSLLGIDRAREQAAMLVDQAVAHLHGFGAEADLLRDIARFILSRDR